MKKIKLMTLASIGAAALAFSPAVHAQAVGGSIADFSNNTGAGGSFTTGFSDSVDSNPFTETLNFTTTAGGLLSIFVGSTATSAVDDTDFTSVFLSGTGLAGNVLVPQLTGDAQGTEVRSLAGLPVGAGSFTLTVQGTPGTQNGSFGGNLAFVAQSAVPEPSTWAMMLFGFGAMGVAVRRRKRGASLTQMA